MNFPIYLKTAFVKALVFSGSIVSVQVIALTFGVNVVGAYSVALSAVLLLSLFLRAGLPILLLRSRVEIDFQKPEEQYKALEYNLLTLQGRKILVLIVWCSLVAYLILLDLGDAIWFYLALTPLSFAGAWLQLVVH